MALSYTSTQGTLFIPQATTSIQVASAPAGTAATGIVAIVGEADAGAPYTLEVATQGLANNKFGPGQLSAFVAKYKSGPLVDAFRALVQPSKDQQIPGAPSAIIAVKTNGASTALGTTSSIKAELGLTDFSGTSYGTLFDQNFGTLGNLLYTSITAATPETLPTTGPFTWIPNVATLDVNLRANGGSSAGVLEQALSVTAGTTPAGLVAAITATGIAAAGGASVSTIVAATGTLAIAVVSGNNVTFTYSQAWTVQPQVGDTIIISTGSVIAGGSSQNVGGYVVTASGTTTVAATKLADGTGGTPGTVTAPVGVSAIAPSGTPNTDFEDFGPVTISVAPNTTTTGIQALPTSTINVTSVAALPAAGTVFITTSAGVQTVEYTSTASGQLLGCTGGKGSTSVGGFVDLPVDGLGRSLTISALTSGTDIFDRYAFALSTVPVLWVSTPARPQVIAPVSEYQLQQVDQRQVDGLNESITAGGVVALSIGYVGDTASLTVSMVNGQLQLSSAVTGGAGSALPTVLASAFPTISAFVAWVNTKTGWYAATPNGRAGLQPLSSLDQGVFTCTASLAGEFTARVKTDAYSYFQALSGSIAVQLGNPAAQAPAGLPAPFIGNDFLSGASRGGTLGSDVTGAIDALKVCTLNFIVPLFSRDAIVGTDTLSTPTADVPNGVTESDSTYVLSGIHNYVLTHCLQQSQIQYKHNRQGFLSCRTTFAQAKDFATTQGNGRVSMCFQDVKLSNSQGQTTQYQPYILACLAAGMQAAGGYRLIVNKYINCSGVLQAAGDFNDQDIDQLNSALTEGLLPAQLATDGSNQFWWVSDQTTYCTDDNFYANSIQAIYVGDIVALTLSMRAQKAFVGQSVADVTANQGVSFISAVMTDMKRLKYIAPSADALKGWKNLSINVNPPAMTFGLEIKLATGIYFVPIQATFSQVQQSASSGVSSS